MIWPSALPGADEKLLDRFLAKVERDQKTGCWIWKAHIAGSHGGYGMIAVNRRSQCAHRVAHELFIGPIPAGLTIDHLCRNKHCVNPAHLEAVTQGENNRRDYEARGCRNGLHPRTPGSSYVSPRGSRICRECQNERMRRYREKKRQLA